MYKKLIEEIEKNNITYKELAITLEVEKEETIEKMLKGKKAIFLIDAFKIIKLLEERANKKYNIEELFIIE